MRMYDIIEKKRDGLEISYEEIQFFIKGYCEGTIPDYQVSALLMAVFIRGMNEKETAFLTEIMANSGDQIDLTPIEGIKVDKHSTGGVGDKTTLVLAPIVAALGVPVAKMSGRGLGHTGGTIDKLESIPGFKTSLSMGEFIEQVKDVGIAVAGQTGNLVPADKKLYALRDVTATVNNISLIASSIMSKKIASGANKIVLDVKTGSGAFMKTMEDSIALAKAMVDIGERVGRETAAIVTDMDIPLGNAIGNALEVMEAMDTLKGKGPKDLEEVSLNIAAKMLELAGLGSYEECRRLSSRAIENGSALAKFTQMIEKQGGDSAVTGNYSLFGNASVIYEFVSPIEGYIEKMKTDLLGTASVILGAGRETKESAIDPLAGIILSKKTGMHVKKGEVIIRLYTNDSGKIAEAVKVLERAVHIGAKPPQERPLILAYIDKKGITVN
ncbi:MAG: pyrimidine-nucleoside phosphorylase [Clostridia bacterium]|nr:pyrimidine-nucleoside phosphorylase [Clostridia bacterium]